MTAWQSPYLPFWIAAALLFVVVVGFLVYSWRTNTKSRIKRLIKTLSTESLRDVLLPDGMDGQIHIDYLLLTAKGLLVLDIKDVSGIIFGSDRMDKWTVISGQRRFTIQNPQGPLFDRVAAVKLIARDVPVNGLVVFTPGGRFTKGMPSAVAMMDSLVEEFSRLRGAGAERSVEAFYSNWEKVKQTAIPA